MPVCVRERKEEEWLRERERQTDMHIGGGGKWGGGSEPVFKRDRPREKARECVYV